MYGSGPQPYQLQKKGNVYQCTCRSPPAPHPLPRTTPPARQRQVRAQGRRPATGLAKPRVPSAGGAGANLRRRSVRGRDMRGGGSSGAKYEGRRGLGRRGTRTGGAGRRRVIRARVAAGCEKRERGGGAGGSIWRHMDDLEQRRTCKHLQQLRGEKAETGRVGEQVPLAAAEPTRPSLAGAPCTGDGGGGLGVRVVSGGGPAGGKPSRGGLPDACGPAQREPARPPGERRNAHRGGGGGRGQASHPPAPRLGYLGAF